MTPSCRCPRPRCSPRPATRIVPSKQCQPPSSSHLHNTRQHRPRSTSRHRPSSSSSSSRPTAPPRCSSRRPRLLCRRRCRGRRQCSRVRRSGAGGRCRSRTPRPTCRATQPFPWGSHSLPSAAATAAPRRCLTLHRRRCLAGPLRSPRRPAGGCCGTGSGSVDLIAPSGSTPIYFAP